MANLMQAFLPGYQAGRQMRADAEERERRNQMKELLSGGVPTAPAERQAFVARAADIDPAQAINWQQQFQQMDAARFKQRQVEAPVYAAALADIRDQADYDQRRAYLARQGMDVSDMPETYDPRQVNMVVQGYRALAGGEPFTLKEGEVRYGPGGAVVAEREAEVPSGPFEGKSMDAQALNMLLTGDPASPEYRAAWTHYGQSRTTIDPVTGRAFTQRPDMSGFRAPTTAAAAASPPMGSPKDLTGRQEAPKETVVQPPTPSIEVTQVAEPKLTMAEAQQRASFDQAGKDIRSAREILFPDGEFDRMAAGTAAVAAPGTEGRTAAQAMRRSIEVLLRLRTGAAAPSHEVDSYMAQFMPSPFDTPEQAKAKIDAADDFFSGTEAYFGQARGGGAGDEPEPSDAAEAPRRAANETPAGADLSGLSNEQLLNMEITEENAEAWNAEYERRMRQ